MMTVVSGKAPIYLLNSMFALAAPLSQDETLKQNHPAAAEASGQTAAEWRKGMKFAEAAVRQLFGTGGEVDMRRFPGEELEVAQALCCLDYHYAISRKPGVPFAYFFGHALGILVPLGVSRWGMEITEPPREWPSRLSSPESPIDTAKAAWIHRECHRRVLWVIHWVSMMASAMSMKPKKFEEMDLTMCLPVDEGVFELSMVENVTPGNSAYRRVEDLLKFDLNLFAEYLIIPRPPPQQSQVSDYGHLIRLTAIYTASMAYLQDRSELSRKRLFQRGISGEQQIQGWTPAFESLNDALLVSRQL